MDISLKEIQNSLCLNMIVKNESKIIIRLLESVISIIDCYCICDTGSDDNTVELITNFCNKHNISGKIVSEPFQNFAYNRNFALTSCLGMSDYVLFLDADMILEVKNFNKKTLNETDYYTILQGNETFYYENTRIIKNNGVCKYIGVTHEYISIPDAYKLKPLGKDIIFIRDVGDGGAKTDKFKRDIRLLTEGLEKEPENKDRYLFYLANSYFDNGEYEKAIETYTQKIQLNGWNQEIWYSYYKIGHAYKNLNNISQAIYYWLEGYDYFPERVENLYEIIHHYRNINKSKLARIYYEIAKKVIEDKTILKDRYLFLRNDIYTYKLYYEYSIFAYYLGIRNINNEIVIILNNTSDQSLYNSVLSNMQFYKHVLTPIKTIRYDSKTQINVNNEQTDFYSSSSCLIPNPDISIGGYIMNVRYVNYFITPTGAYLNCDKYIITQNKCLQLNNELSIQSEKMFDLPFVDRRYIGTEDIKIFYDKNASQIMFIGTEFQKNDTIGISIGHYDTNANILIPKEIKCPSHNSSCEKNWIYIDFKESAHILYKWSPLEICKLNEDTNNIELVETKQMPQLFSHARGSTCGFSYSFKKYSVTPNAEEKLSFEHITEIWFIVHLVSYENPRHYYHVIAVFDSSMNLLRYSAPFVFEGDSIEYSLSLVVEYDRVLINYSNWDRTTRIGIYDKAYIESILKYTP